MVSILAFVPCFLFAVTGIPGSLAVPVAVFPAPIVPIAPIVPVAPIVPLPMRVPAQMKKKVKSTYGVKTEQPESVPFTLPNPKFRPRRPGLKPFDVLRNLERSIERNINIDINNNYDNQLSQTMENTQTLPKIMIETSIDGPRIAVSPRLVQNVQPRIVQAQPTAATAVKGTAAAQPTVLVPTVVQPTVQMPKEVEQKVVFVEYQKKPQVVYAKRERNYDNSKGSFKIVNADSGMDFATGSRGLDLVRADRVVSPARSDRVVVVGGNGRDDRNGGFGSDNTINIMAAPAARSANVVSPARSGRVVVVGGDGRDSRDDSSLNLVSVNRGMDLVSPARSGGVVVVGGDSRDDSSLNLVSVNRAGNQRNNDRVVFLDNGNDENNLQVVDLGRRSSVAAAPIRQAVEASRFGGFGSDNTINIMAAPAARSANVVRASAPSRQVVVDAAPANDRVVFLDNGNDENNLHLVDLGRRSSVAAAPVRQAAPSRQANDRVVFLDNGNDENNLHLVDLGRRSSVAAAPVRQAAPSRQAPASDRVVFLDNGNDENNLHMVDLGRRSSVAAAPVRQVAPSRQVMVDTAPVNDQVVFLNNGNDENNVHVVSDLGRRPAVASPVQQQVVVDAGVGTTFNDVVYTDDQSLGGFGSDNTINVIGSANGRASAPSRQVLFDAGVSDSFSDNLVYQDDQNGVSKSYDIGNDNTLNIIGDYGRRPAQAVSVARSAPARSATAREVVVDTGVNDPFNDQLVFVDDQGLGGSKSYDIGNDNTLNLVGDLSRLPAEAAPAALHVPATRSVPAARSAPARGAPAREVVVDAGASTSFNDQLVYVDDQSLGSSKSLDIGNDNSLNLIGDFSRLPAEAAPAARSAPAAHSAAAQSAPAREVIVDAGVSDHYNDLAYLDSQSLGGSTFDGFGSDNTINLIAAPAARSSQTSRSAPAPARQG